jgi:hypothetical protein
VDRIIGNVGYDADYTLSRELNDAEPNFYLLGSKSQARNSNFLLRNGFAQVRDVFARLTGKSDLDLYKKGRT